MTKGRGEWVLRCACPKCRGPNAWAAYAAEASSDIDLPVTRMQSRALRFASKARARKAIRQWPFEGLYTWRPVRLRPKPGRWVVRRHGLYLTHAFRLVAFKSETIEPGGAWGYRQKYAVHFTSRRDARRWAETTGGTVVRLKRALTAQSLPEVLDGLAAKISAAWEEK